MKAVHYGPDRPPAADRTLGWELVKFATRYGLQPDGPRAGRPWRFTREQLIWVLNWYAINDDGSFVYTNGMLRRMKGWGKDPLAALLCLFEWLGPCRFGGWNADGSPRGVPHPAPLVQLAAVSREQTRNTSTLLPGMLSDKAVKAFDVHLGKEISYARGGVARLESVTRSPRGLEGARPTFVLKNETQHWLSLNQGHAMAEVIERNTAKARDGASRVLAISNAHNPGEDSDAERDYLAFEELRQGRIQATGFLYDSREAPPETELIPVATGDDGQLTPEDLARARASLRAGILAARGDAHWVNPDRLIASIYNPKTSPSDSRRFYLNQITAAEDAWCPPAEWGLIANPSRKLVPGELITLGFDGSRTDDHCVLVGCAVSDGHLFPIGVWNPDEYGGEVPREVVDDRVDWAFATYDVVGFYSDVSPWETYVDAWEGRHGVGLCARVSPMHPIAWDMRSRREQTTRAAEQFRAAIREKAISHADDGRLNQYIYNARTRPNRWGEGFEKESRFSPRKIDGADASSLAVRARRDYLALPKDKQRRKATGWSISIA